MGFKGIFISRTCFPDVFLSFVVAIADSAIVVGSVHQTALLNENITVRCQILTNSTESHIQFQWSFSPFNKSEQTVILQAGQEQGTLQSGSVKYLRPDWTDLLVISVDVTDVGTYTCSTPSGASASSDIYVLGEIV